MNRLFSDVRNAKAYTLALGSRQPSSRQMRALIRLAIDLGAWELLAGTALGG
jgi:hypothetical protein